MADSRRGRETRAPRPDRTGVGGLVGSGPSIVGVSGAMRARDVSRPRAADEAAAEKTVVIRRRAAVTGGARPHSTARSGETAPDS